VLGSNYSPFGSALKPAFWIISNTPASVIPSDLTTRVLSLLVMSMVHSAIPSALSRWGFTEATHPLQLILVLNLNSLFFILIYNIHFYLTKLHLFGYLSYSYFCTDLSQLLRI